jgi:anti-sigma-K factor RskA
MDTRHEDMKALVAPYVLGAVPPEEEAAVRAHLTTCDECRAEAESLGSAASALSLAVDPVDLPAGFVERTMARVHDEKPVVQPTPIGSRRRLTWVFSAAALLVVVMVVALVAFGSSGGPDPAEVAALLERPGLDLSSDGVQAKVVETDDGTVFVAQGMEAAPEGKVYELWRMSDSCVPNRTGPCTIRAAGTFDVEDGMVMVEIDDGSAHLDSYDQVAVTVEKEEVEAPTSDPIMASF